MKTPHRARTISKTGLLSLSSELLDQIFELLNTKDRRSFVNANKYLNQEFSKFLYRDLGLLDVASISSSATLASDESTTIGHIDKYSQEPNNILIQYEHSAHSSLHETRLTKILESFSKGDIKRNYVGFTNTTALSKQSVENYQQLLRSIQLPKHTVLPRSRKSDKTSRWGCVLGLAVDEAIPLGEIAPRETKYIYFRPESDINAAISVQRKHSKGIKEIVLFWNDHLRQSGLRIMGVDMFFHMADCIPSYNPKAEFSRFKFLTKIALYAVEIWLLRGISLPATVESLTVAHNFYPLNSLVPRNFGEPQLLRRFLQSKKEKSSLLTEFIHVQRVIWPGAEVEYTDYAAILDLINNTHGMKVQCIQQQLRYDGHLEDFATPTLEIASHRLDERTFNDSEISRFAVQTPLMTKFGLEWNFVREPFFSGSVLPGFISRASSLAKALAPMKRLNTLCLFAGTDQVPSSPSSKAKRAMKQAVQHLGRNLLDQKLPIDLIIVTIRNICYKEKAWQKLSDPYVYRIKAPNGYSGYLKEVEVSQDVELTEEELMDMIPLGADKVIKFKHYEKLKLGKLYMGNREVAAVKEARLKTRAREEHLKQERKRNAGMSNTQIRKRKHLEKRDQLREEMKQRKKKRSDRAGI